MSPFHRFLLLLCSATLVVLVLWWSSPGRTGPEDRSPESTAQEAPPAEAPTLEPLDIREAAEVLQTAEPLPFKTDRPSDRPLHVLSSLPPGTFVPIRELPKVKDGIRMPDGSYLPFLNGMTAAPPIVRDPIHGPVPPVIGKQVDQGGFEWWIHADGSATTSRYGFITIGDKSYWDPTSAHTAVPKRSNYLEAPGEGR